MRAKIKLKYGAKLYKNFRAKHHVGRLSRDDYIVTDYNIDRFFHLRDYDLWTSFDDYVGGSIQVLGRYLPEKYYDKTRVSG